MTATCRWRCASKKERDGGRWIIVLQPVMPLRSRPHVVPTGHEPFDATILIPQAPFEFVTWDARPWQVGKTYTMTIRPATTGRTHGPYPSTEQEETHL